MKLVTKMSSTNRACTYNMVTWSERGTFAILRDSSVSRTSNKSTTEKFKVDVGEGGGGGGGGGGGMAEAEAASSWSIGYQ